MRISEEFGIFWRELEFRQKAAIVGFFLVVVVAFVALVSLNFRAWRETRQFEREAIEAKREAKTALQNAARIAAEKAKVEKEIVQIEAKRDGKITEAEQAHLDTLNARDDHARAVREQRGDDPGPEQLCVELAALGYSCQ